MQECTFCWIYYYMNLLLQESQHGCIVLSRLLFCRNLHNNLLHSIKNTCILLFVFCRSTRTYIREQFFFFKKEKQRKCNFSHLLPKQGDYQGKTISSMYKILHFKCFHLCYESVEQLLCTKTLLLWKALEQLH